MAGDRQSRWASLFILSGALLAACEGLPAGADASDGAGALLSAPLVAVPCATHEDCVATGPCGLAACVGGICHTGKVPGCCVKDSECDDGNLCTVNLCDTAQNVCDFSVKVSGNCCMTQSDCFTGDLCNSGSCVENVCIFGPNVSPECGTVANCNAASKGPCTKAVACGPCGVCQYETLPGCCSKDYQCSDGLACTKDTCDIATHTCKADPVADCCMTHAECDDADPCTIDACVSFQCRHSVDPTAVDAHGVSCAPSGLCASHEDCDDGKPCTVNWCDPVTHGCEFPALQGACCSDKDCPPIDKCHTGACDPLTAQCVMVPIPGSVCCQVAADCPASPDPCLVPSCFYGTCHDKPVPGCCIEDGQCNDQNWGTLDSCDTQTHTCQFVPKNPDETWHPCKTHLQCNDMNKCTLDYCMSGRCVHIEDGVCCAVDGPDSAECDDGNDCTADVCLYSRCRHFPAVPLGAKPGPGCCFSPYDCPGNGPCTVPICQDYTCGYTFTSGFCD